MSLTTKNEAFYVERLTISKIPEYMHGGIIWYLMHGIQPGDFLTAVLENDLREACGRADDENRRLLWDYVSFLYNYAPAIACGSPERVTQWIASFQEARKAAQ